MGASTLERIDPLGRTQIERSFGPCTALVAGTDGSAWVLERRTDFHSRVSRCDDSGQIEIVEEGRGLLSLGSSARWLAIGKEAGIVVILPLDRNSVVPGPLCLHDPVVQILADSSGAGFWFVTRSDRSNIHWFGDDLQLLDSFEIGSSSALVASPSSSTSLWIIDRDLVSRMTIEGVHRRTLSRTRVPEIGALCAMGVEGGGVWIATPGCILAFDSLGRRKPGQGGFTHLVDLVRVP
jgi:hypothetical protein